MTPTADRDRRIADHVDIARRIARKVARRCPSHVEQEDLVSAGMLGLAEAADRYDASRGEPFLVFAAKRIRGAVLDELRRGDIMPRRVRKKAREVDAVRQTLERATGGTADEHAMAATLGVTLAHYRTELAQLVEVKVGSIEELAHAPPAAPADTSPAQRAERSQLLGRVRGALTRLGERDVTILSLLYGDELSCVEVGQVLGVSTSRVCQLHTRAIARLREALEHAPVRAAA